MKKVLVAGGLGFIGSHTVVELVSAGFDPVIIDNLSNSSPEVLKKLKEITGKEIPFFEFDLCDEKRTKEFFETNSDIEAVIHFAAFKAVGESVAHPLRYYRNNLNSLMNILDTLPQKKRQIVFSSSCTVYGEPDSVPVREDAPVKKAESPYGTTKKMSEEILEDAVKADSNLSAISLRYFNPIGAHSSFKIGELPKGVPQNLVPFITQSAIGKRGPVTVFGNDYPTPDGTAIRDYIHVVDLAKAHVAALQKLEEGLPEGKRYEVYNLGTGKGSSVLEVLTTFEKVSGQKLNYTMGARRPGDIMVTFADPTKAEKELGWRAEQDLEDMLRSAWEWEKHLKEISG